MWANSKRLRVQGRQGRKDARSIGLRKILVFVVIVSLVVGLPLWGYDYAYHPYEKTTVVVESVVTVNPITQHDGHHHDHPRRRSLTRDQPDPELRVLVLRTSPRLKGAGASTPGTATRGAGYCPFNVGPLPYYVSTVTCHRPTAANGTTSRDASITPSTGRGSGNLVVWYSIWLVVPVVVWKVCQEERQGGRRPGRERHRGDISSRSSTSRW